MRLRWADREPEGAVFVDRADEHVFIGALHNGGMTPWVHLVWFVPLVAFGISRILPGSNAPTCTDFLAKSGVRLEGLTFLSCEPAQNAQISVLRARYEVSGAQAESLEAQLKQRFGMAPLKFLCCGWEPENGGVGQRRDERGFTYLISMGSEETIVRQRSDWPKLKFFVQVDLMLEEP